MKITIDTSKEFTPKNMAAKLQTSQQNISNMAKRGKLKRRHIPQLGLVLVSKK